MADTPKRTVAARRGKTFDLTSEFQKLVDNAKVTEIAGTIKLGDDEFRVLRKVNSFVLTGVFTGDAAAMRSIFIDLLHEDDRDAFLAWLNTRENMDVEAMAGLLNKLYEVASGHPTS